MVRGVAWHSRGVIDVIGVVGIPGGRSVHGIHLEKSVSKQSHHTESIPTLLGCWGSTLSQ